MARFLGDIGCHGPRGACTADALRVLTRHERGVGEIPAVEIPPVEIPGAEIPTVDGRCPDVCWDEVVSIEALGDKPTFDATIEGTHNFIADGIVVHNSLEQDADVVLFLYRDEIYNRESTDLGIAEVIVAKHRSGPTGMVRLAFLGQYTRFANMARS